jgi:hypothetical protein
MMQPRILPVRLLHALFGNVEADTCLQRPVCQPIQPYGGDRDAEKSTLTLLMSIPLTALLFSNRFTPSNTAIA